MLLTSSKLQIIKSPNSGNKESILYFHHSIYKHYVLKPLSLAEDILGKIWQLKCSIGSVTNTFVIRKRFLLEEVIYTNKNWFLELCTALFSGCTPLLHSPDNFFYNLRTTCAILMKLCPSDANNQTYLQTI